MAAVYPLQRDARDGGGELLEKLWVPRPFLFVNPRSDSEFVSFANACFQDATTPRRLEEALRERYPNAIVRPRLLDGEPVGVWYAYRDGRWVPSGGPEDNSDR
jgi:hypothetical protein